MTVAPFDRDFDLRLAGQTAVVTGAGRGIGLAVTTALLGAGCKVVAGSKQRTEGLGAPLVREALVGMRAAAEIREENSPLAVIVSLAADELWDVEAKRELR